MALLIQEKTGQDGRDLPPTAFDAREQGA